MNKFDQFLSVNRAIFAILTIIILPFVLAWCLIYGVIVGIIGITVDRYEYVRKIIYSDVIQVVRFPKWKREQYKEAYLRASEGHRSSYEVEKEFSEGKRKAPGIIRYAIQDIIIFGIMFYPFLLIWGIATGPIRVFLDYAKWWHKVWFGYSTYRGGW